MADFMQQFASLLLNSPGNLIYHLVLAFSIAGVLPTALSQRANLNYIQGKRTGIGLSLLLILRMLLFLAAGIAGQGMVDDHLLLPPVDRAVTLISLVILMWLWCFPKPLRSADILAVIFGIFTLIVSALMVAWWLFVGSMEVAFNSFEASKISDVIALIILMSGLLIISIRRPVGWGFGLFMIVLLAIGHTLSLGSPSLELDYSGAVRITQVIAYPLLFTIPLRFTGEAIPLQSDLVTEEKRYPRVDPRLLQSFLTLGVENDPDKLCKATTLALAHSMVADLCFLVSPNEEQSELVFDSGYDLIREQYRTGIKLKMGKLPMLVEAIQNKQSLILPATSSASDITNLARALSLANIGHLLATPIVDKTGTVMFVLVLLTPYSGREWNDDDRSRLELIANSLAQILQRNLSQAPYRDEIDALQQKLQIAYQERDTAQQEIERLLTQTELPGEEPGEEESIIAEGEPEPETSVAVTPTEEEQSTEQAELPEAQTGSKIHKILTTEAQEGVNKKLEGEWFLALEEIDRLNKKIMEMEQAQREYASLMGAKLNSESKSEVYANLVKELNSPISSINGYTDFLLAESFGSLGPIQRKFVERIKFSCDRINSILEVTPDSNITLAEKLQLHPESIDLQDVIYSAIERTRFEMLEKRITLDRTRSQYLPTVYADRDALEQVLISLLENAIAVTPEEGKVSIRTQIKEINGGLQKALIQVSDQGGSRAIRNTFQVFTSQPESSILNINHEGIDMAMIKDLVEMQNGSIWIESEEEIGSIINLVMPIFSPIPSDNTDKANQTNSEGEQPKTNGGVQE